MKRAMSDWLKKEATVQNVLLVLTLAGILMLNRAQWLTADPGGRERDRQLQAASNVDQLMKTVTELSTTVAQLQAANDRLSQMAVQEPLRRADVEPTLRAIAARLEEQNMMFRRYLEQYRR